MISDEYRDNLEWACMNMKAYTRKRSKLLPEAFLRPAYKYTKSEVKDKTQENMHEKDWLL